MANKAVSPVVRRAREITHLFSWFNSGALTTGNRKQTWIVPYYGRVKDIVVASTTASSGGAANDIIDVKYSTDSQTWTSLFATAANRPTLISTNTGTWAVLLDSGNVPLQPGWMLAVDVIQVDTTGSALVAMTISLGDR